VRAIVQRVSGPKAGATNSFEASDVDGVPSKRAFSEAETAQFGKSLDKKTVTKGERAVAEFDTIIKDGMIVDGTRLPRYRSDIGIKNGKIAKIGQLNSSDATNRRTNTCPSTTVERGLPTP
jgi:urease alpha subunit